MESLDIIFTLIDPSTFFPSIVCDVLFNYILMLMLAIEIKNSIFLAVQEVILLVSHTAKWGKTNATHTQKWACRHESSQKDVWIMFWAH
jgi:hypothetical protein